MELCAGRGRSVAIMPDVHDGHERAESIIGRESPDMVVFLGDYFDGREGRDPSGTARWLASSMRRPGRVHLLGNHDMHYLSDNPALFCTGRDPAVLEAVQGARVPWERAAPYCWLDGSLLCTHAGLSAAFVRAASGGDSEAGARGVIGGAYAQLEAARSGAGAPLFGAGRARGGPQEAGGITWCDYSEFEDIAGIRQVFGHTRGERVRGCMGPDTGHYCIDTSLNHYAVYRDGAVSVKKA